MPVYITDEDALDRLAQVEGEEWKRRQDREDSDYTLRGFAAAYEREKGRSGYITCGFNHAIYGENGWNRYFVLAGTGEIVFSRKHARRPLLGPDDSGKAEAAGFTLWPRTAEEGR